VGTSPVVVAALEVQGGEQRPNSILIHDKAPQEATLTAATSQHQSPWKRDKSRTDQEMVGPYRRGKRRPPKKRCQRKLAGMWLAISSADQGQRGGVSWRQALVGIPSRKTRGTKFYPGLGEQHLARSVAIQTGNEDRRGQAGESK